MAESDVRILKVGPWPHLGPSNISKGRARALLGPCHATPLLAILNYRATFFGNNDTNGVEIDLVLHFFTTTKKLSSHCDGPVTLAFV